MVTLLATMVGAVSVARGVAIGRHLQQDITVGADMAGMARRWVGVDQDNALT